MGRLKTFRTYIVLIIVFYLFTMIITFIGLNATYKNINLTEDLPEGLSINLAQATSVNGRIYGEVLSSEQNNLEGKYIKVDIFTKKGNDMGTKYIKIENTNINEPKKFAVFFTADNIKYYTIEVLDDTEEVRKQSDLVKELFGDVFTEEELKAVAILTLIIGLVYYV